VALVAYIGLGWLAVSILGAVALGHAAREEEDDRDDIERELDDALGLQVVSWLNIDRPTSRQSRREWSEGRGWGDAPR